MPSAVEIFLSLLLFAAQPAAPPSYQIQTIAGSDVLGDQGPALSAALNQPEGIAVDRRGNLYIADANDHRIRRIGPDGIITTIAGTGIAGLSGDGGPASLAQLNRPYGLAVDANGNLFVADLGNARVRRIGTDGMITTTAGSGTIRPLDGGDGILAVASKLDAPRNLAFDSNGTLFLSDFGANALFSIDPLGTLAIVAGTGQAGFSGDSAAARLAKLNAPAGIAVDAYGTIYVSDTGNRRVRAIRNGVITSIATVPVAAIGLALDSSSTLWLGVPDASAALLTVGSGPAMKQVSGEDVTFNAAGVLYVTGSAVVSKVVGGARTPLVANATTRNYGGDSGPAVKAKLNSPSDVVPDGLGNLYIADENNNRVRRVAADGTITSVLSAASPWSRPGHLASDGQGNVYVSDSGNNRVRKITKGGTVSTVLDNLKAPAQLAVAADGTMYIADQGNDRVVKVAAGGIATTLLAVSHPFGIAVDAQGAVYVSETAHDQILKAASTGALQTILSGDGQPRELALTRDGSLLFSDVQSNQIRALATAGHTSVIAGSGKPGFRGDGSLATQALLNAPAGIAINGDGTLYVADAGNNRIRELIPIATFAAETASLTVANAASGKPGPVAPNEIITVYGSGFQSGNTVLSFDETPAVLLYTGPTQINARVPATLIPGAAPTLTASVAGNAVGQTSVEVAAVSPGLFGAALNQDGTLNSADNSALRGTLAVFFGTGAALTAKSQISLSIANYPAEILYAGDAPGLPGLFQINARVPGGFAPTGTLDVSLTIEGVAAPPIQISVQ